MKDINNVVLVGRLTRDSELRYTKGGTAVLGFSIAVNRSIKRNNEWQDEASFFDCTLFGKFAETMQRYLVKGKQIALTGELQQQRWQKDGMNRSKVQIIVSSLRLLGGKENEQRYNPIRSDGPEDFDDDIQF